MQQQALRDFARAMTTFFDPGHPARRPSWRKAGRDEGFRIVGRGSRAGKSEQRSAAFQEYDPDYRASKHAKVEQAAIAADPTQA